MTTDSSASAPEPVRQKRRWPWFLLGLLLGGGGNTHQTYSGPSIRTFAPIFSVTAHNTQGSSSEVVFGGATGDGESYTVSLTDKLQSLTVSYTGPQSSLQGGVWRAGALNAGEVVPFSVRVFDGSVVSQPDAHDIASVSLAFSDFTDCEQGGGLERYEVAVSFTSVDGASVSNVLGVLACSADE